MTGNPSPLDGNNTYKLTFMPPASDQSLPAVGIYPPMAFAHAGDQQGASATLLLIPKKQLGIAILSNTESFDLDTLAHSTADVLIDR